MPVKKGKLKPEDYKRVKKNYPFILEEIDAKYLVTALYSNDIFDEDDKEEISNASTKTKRNDLFLTLLLNSGPGKAYSVFSEALREEGYDHVADKLEATELDDEEEETEADALEKWFGSLPEDIQNHVITDQDAGFLSSSLGKGFEQFFLRLGTKKVQIEQETMKAGDTPNHVANLLIKWKNKHASNATFKALISNYKSVADVCTIDYDIVKSAISRLEKK